MQYTYLVSQDLDKFFLTQLSIDMSKIDLSHIDTIADSVHFDMCQYLWVLGYTQEKLQR